MNTKTLVCGLALTMLAGCASVPMASNEDNNKAIEFGAPTEGMAGVYIYRTSALGAALKKDLYVNGDCLGETATGVFFYTEVAGDQEHVFSTESEFSPNELTLYTEANELYYLEQYIKMGVFVGGANLRKVESAIGQEQVKFASLAVPGTCTSTQ
uniref:DUF2846 domain-containing protein n=1 Tax=Thaumasiovibrio occultus TaxID=1891184 RepID=UPI000B350B70|nr:DUF2846 domain-containing protein [Thaumasiovibrio occultus]